MPRFTATVTILGLDVENMTKATNEAVLTRSRVASRAFLRAAIPLVPVQTGMARGSFLNLGRLLKVAVPIASLPYTERQVTSQRRTNRGRKWKGGRWRSLVKWYYPPGGGPRIRKTPESGARLSTNASSPDDLFDLNSNKIKFTFQTKVYHFTLAEFHNLGNTGPWFALQRGRDAWFASMSDIRDHLPKFQDFFLETNITYGANSRYVNGPKIRIRTRRKV